MDGCGVVVSAGAVSGRDARRARRAAVEAALEAALEATLGGSGWLMLMAERGKVTEAMRRAAADIGHAQMTDPCASTGVRAMDCSRIVVDGGGPLRLNLHPRELGGHSGPLGGEARARWERYARAVRRRPMKEALLRGRRESVWLDVLVVRVLVDGQRPSLLDTLYGVRQDRVRDAVLRELERYAAEYQF